MPEESIADIAAKCRVLLLDVEGTTTSISFVKDKLFPYATAHVRGFLEAGWGGDEVKGAVEGIRQLAISDAEQKRDGVVLLPGEDASKEEQIDGVVKSVEWLMSQDRKDGALKQLQGLIWQQGYDKGDLKGHVFTDVAGALEAWRALPDHQVYIYSSGSEQAQKLLFAHSEVGDLLPHLDGHFDTKVGHKQEADSYKNIAEKIGCKPEEILFLTDIIQEAEAARAAGLRAALVCRAGNAPLPRDLAFPTLASFADLQADLAGAKRKQDSVDEQPAKIAKAALEDDVKSSAENLVTGIIDVDTSATNTEIKEKGPETAEVTEKEEITIEEVMDTTEAEPIPEVPVEVVEPVPDIVVTKTAEKTEPSVANGTEKLEKEETLPATIMEIEEVTDEKPEEMVETVDMEPTVEEPTESSPDAEQDNVAELVQKGCDELEKECDELMSKVKDVTDLLGTIDEGNENADNLDSIPAEVMDELVTKEAEEEQKDRLAEVEVHLNGDSKEANGVAHNGGSNGTEKVNGADNGTENVNGAGNGTEKVNGAEGKEADEIKVKTVPAAEHSDPPSQAADA